MPAIKGLFHLPPGLDFAEHFVHGLLKRAADEPPEALARITVYLNSERMRRRVTEALTRSGARLLPRLLLVTDLGQDPILADLPPPEPRLRRLLTLGQLVQSLLARDPSIGPASAAFDLAASLSDLIDEMQAEGVTPAQVARLEMDRHAEYWLRTQAFLTIIAPFFAADGATDPAARQRIAANRLAARWQAAPPPGPVIVAGSTGSRGPTLRLMLAVAGLPKGALVLPGFDSAMPEPVWDQMKDALTAEDHPQFRIRRLIEALKIRPRDVAPWHCALAPDGARNVVISLSLRPAPVTDQWLAEGQKLRDLPGALSGMSLVQAETAQEEAAVIALILRHSAERAIPTALITADRALGRRVSAALTAWGILPDDAAGKPLALSPPGRFLRHVAEMISQRLTSDKLLILLKHPLSHSALRRGEHLLLTRELELHLRRYGPAFPTAESLADWAATRDNPFATEWATALGQCIATLPLPAEAPLHQAQAHHLSLAEAFARGTAPEGTGELWLKEAGANARALFAELAEDAGHGAPVSPSEYLRLFETLIHQLGKDSRETLAAHPFLTILGPREARETNAQRVILAGLNEGIWPRQSAPDPWMNRKMRQEAGLLLPERQIGLAAHDYQQASAAPEVIFTRARRNADAETVPSRWLNRLTNLLNGLPDQGGDQALGELIQRGEHWRNLARRAAEPPAESAADPALLRARRPAPRPPVAARPTVLSLTRIRDLIRDPYAIYASRVLRLSKLDPLRASPDARDRGIVMHEVMEKFIRNTPESETPRDAEARLLALTKLLLDRAIDFPTERLLWYARMAGVAERIVSAEAERNSRPAALEVKGKMTFINPDFTLEGRLDRANILPDGRVEVIDYKTGTPPTKAQEDTFEKQLLLTALMVENGAFEGLAEAEVARTLYVGLKDPEAPLKTEITPEKLQEVYARFHHLIAQYAKRSTGYISRRALQRDEEDRDFDHLARFGEWQMSDPAEPEDVGGPDAAP
jgi:ATP-dependent helicase/nuclease subunit B